MRKNVKGVGKLLVDLTKKAVPVERLFYFSDGGGRGIRTPDLLHAMQAL
jgi:hypothetical protein